MDQASLYRDGLSVTAGPHPSRRQVPNFYGGGRTTGTTTQNGLHSAGEADPSVVMNAKMDQMIICCQVLNRCCSLSKTHANDWKAL